MWGKGRGLGSLNGVLWVFMLVKGCILGEDSGDEKGIGNGRCVQENENREVEGYCVYRVH